MIVNHKYKFIFFNPQKTGSTSVQVSLAEICAGSDIWCFRNKKDIESIYDNVSYYETLKKESFDEDAFALAKRYGKHWSPRQVQNILKQTRFKKKWGNSVWKDYLKVAVIRNPWDAEVSSFWWSNKKQNLVDKDPKHVNNSFQTKDRFLPWQKYYLLDGKPCIDHTLRFENLEEDFNELLYILKAPRVELKKWGIWVKTRKDRRHYSTYYMGESGQRKKEKVQQQYLKFLKMYPYEFENLGD